MASTAPSTNNWILQSTNNIEKVASTGNSSSFLLFNNAVNNSFSLGADIGLSPIYAGTGTPSIDQYLQAGFVFDVVSTGDSTYQYQYCAVYATGFLNTTLSNYTFSIVVKLSTGNRTGATGYNALTTNVSMPAYNFNNQFNLAVKRIGSHLQVYFNKTIVTFPTFYSDLHEGTYNIPNWVGNGTYVLAQPQQNQVITNSVGLYLGYSSSTPPTGSNTEWATWSNVCLTDFEYDRSTDFDIADVTSMGGVKDIILPNQFIDTFTNLNNWQ